MKAERGGGVWQDGTTMVGRGKHWGCLPATMGVYKKEWVLN